MGPGTDTVGSASDVGWLSLGVSPRPLNHPADFGRLIAEYREVGQGTARVACSNDPTIALQVATITSGARATNSAA